MIRPLAILTVLLAASSASFAQEAATTPPAATDIRIDPSAAVGGLSKQARMLEGLYFTQAVIDICAVTVPEDVATRMASDRAVFEAGVGLDAAAATDAYEKIKTGVAGTTPDCAEGSQDRANVEAVMSLYAAK